MKKLSSILSILLVAIMILGNLAACTTVPQETEGTTNSQTTSKPEETVKETVTSEATSTAPIKDETVAEPDARS